jgi:hypothetical protein
MSNYSAVNENFVQRVARFAGKQAESRREIVLAATDRHRRERYIVGRWAKNIVYPHNFENS